MAGIPTTGLPLGLAGFFETSWAGVREQLAAISDDTLWQAWTSTVDAFLDPESKERRVLDPSLKTQCGLSEEGLQAGLDAVLRGVRGAAARRLLQRAGTRPAAAPGAITVLLAGNLPALAVQPLLPALALRRPVLLKSSSRETAFAPAFVDSLVSREPRLRQALLATTWKGGDRAVEDRVLKASAKVIAYGDGATIDDLRRRCPVPLVTYGPRLSLAAVGPSADLPKVAAGIARDVALFEQQGCLSIHAVYTSGDPNALAQALRHALQALARRWPPGPAPLPLLAAVQQLRAEAEMRGLASPAWTTGKASANLRNGTVLVEPEVSFAPSPGLRTVRVHGLESLEELPRILAPWQGLLQGVAFAGEEPKGLRSGLKRLGVSRFSATGKLQTPDASWRNGGLDPLDALG